VLAVSTEWLAVLPVGFASRHLGKLAVLIVMLVVVLVVWLVRHFVQLRNSPLRHFGALVLHYGDEALEVM
jgi:hypothetical protein